MQVGPRLWKLIPWALPGHDLPASAALSDVVIAAQIEVAARRVLPAERVLVTFDPVRGRLRGVGRDLTVYWRRDLAACAPYVSSVALARARHRRLLRRADLVTAVSPDLVEDSRRVNPNVVLLPNGADVAHFAHEARPPDELTLLAAGRPIVGYLGAVSWRVDVDLLERLARRRPDWFFVLIGDVSVAVPRVANLAVAGPRRYADLAPWAQSFDVGIVPYRDDAFNRASFPLKVFDYLAAGVPVVSSRLPAIEPLHGVQSARGVDGFETAIAAMIDRRPSRASCRAVAAANSWDVRAAELENLVEQRAGRALFV